MARIEGELILGSLRRKRFPFNSDLYPVRVNLGKSGNIEISTNSSWVGIKFQGFENRGPFDVSTFGRDGRRTHREYLDPAKGISIPGESKAIKVRGKGVRFSVTKVSD